MSLDPKEMARRIGEGLLSFPVTHFNDRLAFDEPAFRAHCSRLMGYDIAGLFAAGGTGEFFSLTPAEIDAVVRAAVDEAKGQVPVIAGCGYGTAIAVELAAAAERNGADGILLLPPYLVQPSQQGLVAHIEAICRATGLGVIVYNRDNAVLEAETVERLCERNPNLVGFKDGVGNIELITRIRSRLGDRLTYIGGLPTAETFALPYLTMGVTTYSSAIFNFLPRWATRFYHAVRANDHAILETELREFLLPYVTLRNRSPGYAVSIIKAGLSLTGYSAGSVRPPLTDLTGDELTQLRAIVADRHAPLAIDSVDRGPKESA